MFAQIEKSGTGKTRVHTCPPRQRTRHTCCTLLHSICLQSILRGDLLVDLFTRNIHAYAPALHKSDPSALSSGCMKEHLDGNAHIHTHTQACLSTQTLGALFHYALKPIQVICVHKHGPALVFPFCLSQLYILRASVGSRKSHTHTPGENQYFVCVWVRACHVVLNWPCCW